MLLIGIDVPPLGPPPIRPGGEWPGADFALGTHGPSTTGQVVRLGRGAPATTRLVAAFKVTTCGKSLTFSIPLAAIGGPAWFRFSIAVARETTNEASEGGLDLLPDRGTLRYALAD